MRLTPQEIDAIKTAANEAFGTGTVVRLFGSRVHDHLRGGDIDLHVETDPVPDEWDARDAFLERLFRHIDRQKVDVVITQRGGIPRGFERIGYRDGIPL